VGSARSRTGSSPVASWSTSSRASGVTPVLTSTGSPLDHCGYRYWAGGWFHPRSTPGSSTR
jgi:hypothetical protein